MGADDLAGATLTVARNRYGCRVIMRLFEHCMSDASTVALVDEMSQSMTALCRDEFAYHTIESLLQHGSSQHRHLVVQAIQRDLWTNATDRSATYIITAVLSHCDRQECQGLVEALMRRGVDGLECLRRSEWGAHVLKTLQWVARKRREVFTDLGIDREILKELCRVR